MCQVSTPARCAIYTAPPIAFWKGNPLISGKSRLVKYYNLAREMENSTPFFPIGLLKKHLATFSGGKKTSTLSGILWAR